MAGVLDGIRVLDLSWGISGPMATMLLADHGADVTKIEPPGGDPFRDGLGYRIWQRGKRSAILDLKDAGDLAVFRQLADRADVLVESFRPGVTERLGIDYSALSQSNPSLVYCSITGYGRDNRHSDRPGYDALVAARSGLQWEQRGWPGGSAPRLAGREPLFPDLEIPQEEMQGAPREGPLFPASRFPSLGACYAAVTAISAALRARERTGRGQWVETSLLRGALAAGVMSFGKAEDFEAAGFMTWVGDSRSQKGLFECKDGRWVHCWPPNPRFVLAAGEGDTLDAHPDLRVRDDPDRIALATEEIFVLHHYWEPMAKTIKKFTADEWTQAGADAGVCIQKILTPEEGLADPLLFDDGCVAEIEDPEVGRIRGVGITYRLDTSPGEIRGPAPRAGQHTDEVRAEAAAAAEAPTPAPGKGESLAGGPLEGIRVLDFGLAVAGPYATQILSDLGASVIKINAKHDWYWHQCQIAMCCNSGKSSIAIDLKHENAKDVVRRLIASADVLMHNMRYPAAVKLGIDYASLKDEFPGLVYCHSRGFERGPREQLPGNDQTGACLAGVEWEDGGCHRGGRPFWSLTSMGDTGNGFLAATAICQALYEREKTGRGQWVDTAIVNAQLLNTSYAIARADGTGFERPLLDAMQTGFSAGVRLYPTADGWLCLSLVSDAHWEALGRALGEGALEAGGRFAMAEAREAADDEVAKIVEHALATRSAADWLGVLDAAGVPCEVSSDRAGIEMWDDPESLERAWIARFPHPVVKELGQVGLAFEFSETPARVQGPPCIVGADTRDVLADLGYDVAEIEALFESGAVGDETVNPMLAPEGAETAKSPWEPE
ncbi:MAG: CoA transferase [Deltaproteobacteria bacterium]|nr:CoA transferase [Deltaproteobacteria bacterium]